MIRFDLTIDEILDYAKITEGETMICRESSKGH